MEPDELKELMSELLKDGEECLRDFKLYGERNEKFVSGEQFVEINPTTFQMDDAWHSFLPKYTQNHLRNIFNTWKARMTKDRPSVTAWSTNNSPQAKAAAGVAKKLIEYHEKELSIDLLLDDVVGYGGLHGSAGFKIIYNPDSELIEWYKLSIYDYILDPNHEDNPEWCIFRTYLDKWTARESYKQIGIDTTPPVTTYKVNNLEDREGVEHLELWHKPCARFPDGLFLQILGDQVLASEPYPYIFTNLDNGKNEAVLPLVQFKVFNKRGCPYGETWLNDAIPEQRQVNEIEATLIKLRRQTGNIKLLVSDSSLAQQINSDSQMLIGSGQVQYVSPPVVNNLLFSDRDHHFQRLYDLAGLNDQLVGVSSVKSGTSAKQIAYLSELDGMKHKGTSQSIETMLIKAWKLSLQLIQKHYIAERIIRIASADYVEELQFKGADIQGVTVSLEPRAGLERMSANKVAQVEADAQAGLIKPEQVFEARQTGQLESTLSYIIKQKVEKDVSDLLVGATILPDDSLDPTLVVQEVDNLIALSNLKPDRIQDILEYRDYYKSKLEVPATE